MSQVPQAAAFGPVPDAIANPLCHLAVTQLTCSCPALGMPRSHRLSSSPPSCPQGHSGGFRNITHGVPGSVRHRASEASVCVEPALGLALGMTACLLLVHKGLGPGTGCANLSRALLKT